MKIKLSVAVVCFAMILLIPGLSASFITEVSLIGIDESIINKTNQTLVYTGFPVGVSSIPYQAFVTNRDSDVEGTVTATVSITYRNLTSQVLFNSNFTYAVGIISTDGIILTIPERSTVTLTLERLTGNITRWDISQIHKSDFTIQIVETSPLATATILSGFNDILNFEISVLTNIGFLLDFILLLWDNFIKWIVLFELMLWGVRRINSSLFRTMDSITGAG